MNLREKKLDLLGQRKTRLDEAQKALTENGSSSEEYKAAMEAVKQLNDELVELERLIVEAEKSFGAGPVPVQGGMPVPAAKVYGDEHPALKGLKAETVKSFAASIRKAMTEGTGSAGGYTVPEDVVNRIYSLIEAEDNMLPYVTNTPVTTNSGKRTYKTRAQKVGFSTVAEGAAMGSVANPTFAQISYTIAKRGGYLPVTEELLEDSDENIASLVIAWLVDEARVTINKNIVAKAESLSPVGIDPTAGLDGLLRILTSVLGSAFRARSTIHTNDDGLLWLLTLKDKNGRALMNADPTQPARMLLCVGPVNVPIKIWDNGTLPTDSVSGKVPFIIGDLQEGIQRFDRRQITVQRLTEATVGSLNLAEMGMVAFKATMRDDYQVRDSAAWVYATVIPGGSAVTPVSMAVTHAPTKTSYTAGQDFAKAGMVCTVTYSDGSTAAVDNDKIVALNGSAMTAGTTSVTLLYTESGVIVSATQAVTVS